MKYLVDGALEIIGYAVLATAPIWILQFLLISYLIIPPFVSDIFDPVKIKVEIPVFDRYLKETPKYLDEKKTLEIHKEETDQLVQNIYNCRKIVLEKTLINNKLKKNRAICKKCNCSNNDLKNYLYYECICDRKLFNLEMINIAKEDLLTSIRRYGENQYNIAKCLFQLSSDTDTDNSELLFHLNELYNVEKLIYESDRYSSELHYLDTQISTMTRWLENSGIPKESYEGMINHF